MSDGNQWQDAISTAVTVLRSYGQPYIKPFGAGIFFLILAHPV